MNSPEQKPTNQNPTPGKYKEALDDKTRILKESASDENEIHPVSKEFNAEDPISRDRDTDKSLNIDPDTDISQEEIDDLEKSATRMPNEDDDLLDGDNLADEDEDGTPLNEDDDPLGEDLDISPEDKDANEYDNITE